MTTFSRMRAAAGVASIGDPPIAALPSTIRRAVTGSWLVDRRTHGLDWLPHLLFVLLLGVSLGWGTPTHAQPPVVEIVSVRCSASAGLLTTCPDGMSSGECSAASYFGVGTPGEARCTAFLPPPCSHTLVARAGAALSCSILRADDNDPTSAPVGLAIEDSAWAEQLSSQGLSGADLGGSTTADFIVHSPGAHFVIDFVGGFYQGFTQVVNAQNVIVTSPLPPGHYSLQHYRFFTSGSGSRTGRTIITFGAATVGFGSGSAPTTPLPLDGNGCVALGGSSAWIAAPVSPRLRLTIGAAPSPPGTLLASLTLPTGLADPVRVFADGAALGEFAPGESLNLGALLNTAGASTVEIDGVRPSVSATTTLPIWLSHTGQTATVCIESLPCRADFNGMSGLTVQDIFDFLAAFFSNDPAADFNNAGGITVQDIFDYLAAYFAGCP